MAACLRSLRLGVPSIVPGGAGCGTVRKGYTRRSGVQSAFKATAAPLQQHKGEAAAAAAPSSSSSSWWFSPVLPLYNYDPISCISCPAAQTLDDIEVNCTNEYNTTTTTTTTTVTEHQASKKHTSIRTFRLPSNALWYPEDSQHKDGSILCSLAYSPLETEVINTINTTQTPPHREQAVFDIAAFIKGMGLRDGEVVACGNITAGPSTSGKADGGSGGDGMPSGEQLSFVFQKLAETLPKLFVQPLDYTIYSQDIVFENRIRGVRTVGLFPYVRQVALLRTVGHLKFAYVRFEILKITKHPEEGCVKVRWRIKGLSGLKALFRFWKIKFWNWPSVEEQMVSWYDGFSTFHVAGDGLVHTHVADSMMPDEEHKIAEKDTLALKMAALLGLVHRPSSSSSVNTTTTTTTSNSKELHHHHHHHSATTTTTATTATAATATTATIDLLEKDRDCFTGLMLPLEKIH